MLAALRRHLPIPHRSAPCLCLAAALLAFPARADDPIVIRAMTASTIAEVYVDRDGVRIELEIGVADLKAFANLLPDELYQKLGLEGQPWAERLGAFFESDLVLRADGQTPLTGEITRVQVRRRIKRDEITGEPLPVAENEGEPVVVVELRYPLPEHPATFTLKPPTEGDEDRVAANIGFVLYHRGLPVNDFRYLSGEETLDLDWDDPWFSRFRNRNLLRRHESPIAGYLYVEHFEVRQEIIVRPRDLQQWVDLGLHGETIPIADQESIKQKVAAFLAERNAVTIDGQPVQLELDRIHFLRRSLKQTGVIDPPEDLDVASATLGVIFVVPIEALPQDVKMNWDLFPPRVIRVPASASDEAGGLPTILTAEDPVLHWQNFLTNPKAPTLASIAPPPEPARLPLPLVSLLCTGAALWLVVRAMKSADAARPRRLAGGVLATVAAVLCFPLLQVSVPIPLTGAGTLGTEATSQVLGGLLHNVYRAFDRRGEELIYDTLARSVEGDLLADIYLEAQRGLELENQGGAQARVTAVELVEVAPRARDDEGVGFASRCTWIVSGSVGHWGHIHQRQNQYQADFVVSEVNGHWKITAMELLEERRI